VIVCYLAPFVPYCLTCVVLYVCTLLTGLAVPVTGIVLGTDLLVACLWVISVACYLFLCGLLLVAIFAYACMLLFVYCFFVKKFWTLINLGISGL
jgi:hypothetical protein